MRPDQAPELGRQRFSDLDQHVAIIQTFLFEHRADDAGHSVSHLHRRLIEFFAEPALKSERADQALLDMQRHREHRSKTVRGSELGMLAGDAVLPVFHHRITNDRMLVDSLVHRGANVPDEVHSRTESRSVGNRDDFSLVAANKPDTHLIAV